MSKAYPSSRRWDSRCAALASFMILYGCGPRTDSLSTAETARSPAQSPAQAPVQSSKKSPAQRTPVTVPPVGQTTVATPVDARPAALVNGRGVDWGELRPILTEAAGADALREVILDRQLADALAAAGITLGPDDLAGERKLLLERLDTDPNQAVRLLDELRDRQKLGPHRFERLLRRNAGLRALVQGKAQVSEEAVAIRFDALHGAKRQARIILVRSLNAAEDAARRITAGEPFSDVAAKVSIDLSAARGGLLEPMSASDLAYPKAVRDTIWSLAPGQVSNPVLLEDNFAIVQLVSETPPDGVSLADARPTLERIVRLAQEQLLMDQLARQLIGDVTVTIFDDSLEDSWTRSRRSRP